MSVFNSPRATTVTINAEAFDPIGLLAIAQFVRDYEAKYAKDSTVGDIGDPTPASEVPVKVAIPSVTPYSIFVFDVYADISAGTYNFNFVEEVPNHESIS